MQFRKKGQAVPAYLSHSSKILSTSMNDISLRRAGFTTEDMASMTRTQVEVYGRLIRGGMA